MRDASMLRGGSIVGRLWEGRRQENEDRDEHGIGFEIFLFGELSALCCLTSYRSQLAPSIFTARLRNREKE